MPQAREYYEQALASRRKLVAAAANELAPQADLMVSYYKLGRLEEKSLEFPKAGPGSSKDRRCCAS